MLQRLPALFALFALGALISSQLAFGGEPMPSSPAHPPAPTQSAIATLGGGCFWCLDAVFRLVPGVISVTSGYAGGTKESPTYEEVCHGNTGHAEVVQIVFDPEKVSFSKLLETFWMIHDPTSLNRQGNDLGTQYRSVIFYQDEAQKTAAEASKAAEQARWKAPIVTEIVPLKKFWPAEEYHQNYFARNPGNAYCQYVVRPKVEKAQKAR